MSNGDKRERGRTGQAEPSQGPLHPPARQRTAISAGQAAPLRVGGVRQTTLDVLSLGILSLWGPDVARAQPFPLNLLQAPRRRALKRMFRRAPSGTPALAPKENSPEERISLALCDVGAIRKKQYSEMVQNDRSQGGSLIGDPRASFSCSGSTAAAQPLVRALVVRRKPLSAAVQALQAAVGLSAACPRGPARTHLCEGLVRGGALSSRALTVEKSHRTNCSLRGGHAPEEKRLSKRLSKRLQIGPVIPLLPQEQELHAEKVDLSRANHGQFARLAKIAGRPKPARLSPSTFTPARRARSPLARRHAGTLPSTIAPPATNASAPMATRCCTAAPPARAGHQQVKIKGGSIAMGFRFNFT